jgi:Uma2 family endonuclease
MNERIALGSLTPATTQAAEGLPRRLWTLVEIEAMVAAGIIDEDERFELIGGEVVPMSPKGARHEIVKIELNEHLQRVKSNDIRIAQETTLRLDEKNFVEPDFCVFSRSVSPGDMRGPDVLLAIEIADTSLAYDRGRKIGIYAAFGIAEIWVIDANRLVTHIYRELGAQGYGSITMASASDMLEARRATSVRVNLAELGLKPLVRRR